MGTSSVVNEFEVFNDCSAVTGVESIAVCACHWFVANHKAKDFPLVKVKDGCGFLCCFEEHVGS